MGEFATADSGFHQTIPSLGNIYETDRVLQEILQQYLPHEILKVVDRDLRQFSNLTQNTISHLGDHCERNPPQLESYDAWCQRVDRIHTSPCWKELKSISAREGLVSIGFDRKNYQQFARIYQFAKMYIFAADSAMFGCPLSMTDGAARVIELLGNSKQKAEVLPRLLSRDGSRFQTSGQWMTERPGGSDVSQTETKAELVNPNLDLWHVSGFKWFSSATDADMALLLARTRNPDASDWIEGSAGLTLFWAPMRNDDGSLNGVKIHRLKQKYGTKAVPTAELQLENMKAYKIGPIGRGVASIATILNITRIHSAISSLAYMNRGIQMAKAFASTRKVQGKLLVDNPLHMRHLAKISHIHIACMHLAFYVISLLGKSENGSASASEEAILRILTPVCKMWISKQSVQVMSEAMEALGGQGYMEDVGLARHLRDTQVNAIWEGTTNVLGLDVCRVLSKSKSGSFIQYRQEFELKLRGVSDEFSKEASACSEALNYLDDYARNYSNKEYGAREFGFAIARVTSGILMLKHATLAPTDAKKLAAQKWCCCKEALIGDLAKLHKDNYNEDCLLVFGKQSHL